MPGGATLTFDLIGYLTVDGNNGYNDTFNLTVNGTQLFSGGFDMGGAGVTIVSSTTYGFGQGG